jgi:hypothetical protein
VLVLVGLGGYLWFWMLGRTLRVLAFPHVPAWSVGLLSLCYALGGVGPYLQALPTIYHEAFVWASFFLLGGLYWWLRGLDGKGGTIWKLALAGGLFGCAVGSRTTVILYPLVAGLVLAIAWLRAPGSWPSAFPSAPRWLSSRCTTRLVSARRSSSASLWGSAGRTGGSAGRPGGSSWRPCPSTSGRISC